MYSVLARSRVTLNAHIDRIAHADNCRLFEATGVGTLLVTDWKPDLDEILEPGREALAYRTAEECAAFIDHQLTHEDERAAIARAGQTRTLAEHTYGRRMEELLAILDSRLRRKPG
jgi:spore maturation protein CgeB